MKGNVIISPKSGGTNMKNWGWFWVYAIISIALLVSGAIMTFSNDGILATRGYLALFLGITSFVAAGNEYVKMKRRERDG